MKEVRDALADLSNRSLPAPPERDLAKVFGRNHYRDRYL